MASITIRNLDEDVRDRLRQRAAEHGLSMEAEVRAILRSAVDPPSFVGAWVEAFQQLGGVDLPLPARGPAQPIDME